LGDSNRGFAPLFNISLFFEEEKDQRRVRGELKRGEASLI